MNRKVIISLLIFYIGFNSDLLGQKTGIESSNKVFISVKSPPEIHWLDYDEDTISINYSITQINIGINCKIDLNNVEFYINDILADRYSSQQLSNQDSDDHYNYLISNNYTFRNGLNVIKVIAENAKQVKSESQKIILAHIQAITVLIDQDDKEAPQILVSSPPNIRNNIVRYSKDLLTVQGVVIDDYGIKMLKINGHETPINRNGGFVIKLPLSFGHNEVMVEAIDVNGNIGLKRFIVDRRSLSGEEYNPEQANNYLFVIGIDNYTQWPKLNNAVRDAKDVKDVLIDRYKFEPEKVTFLTNEQANRNNIYDELKKLIETLNPQDNLFIYYSGHGYFDQLLMEGYWIPFDAQKNTAGDYIPNSTLVRYLQNLNSQHIFLVIDACFSGALFASSNKGYIENIEKYKSRWGLASGRLETVSDGQINENSPFARCLIDFLKKNEKEKVLVSEIVQYVKINVPEISNQTPIGSPLKNLGDEGGEFVFYLRSVEE